MVGPDGQVFGVCRDPAGQHRDLVSGARLAATGDCGGKGDANIGDAGMWIQIVWLGIKSP